MNSIARAAFALCVLFVAVAAEASGPAGIFAIIERVEFEPDEQSAERIRVYGAFAFVDTDSRANVSHTEPARGFMYFALPPDGNPANVHREWSDLAAVAGTGEAVAFGRYGYIGGLENLPTAVDERARSARTSNSYFVDGIGHGGVYAEGAESGGPASYRSDNVGVVKLGQGNYPEIVARLRAVLTE